MQIADVKTRQINNNDNNIEDSDPLFERKIQNATEGLSHDCFIWLKRIANNNKDNIILITNYLISVKIETNLSDGYRRSLIILFSKFSIFFKNQRSYKSLTREDVLKFLDSFRKPESVDPMHKWIGTYIIYRIHLMRFFKW